MVKGTDVGLALYLRTHGSAIRPSGCLAFGGEKIPLRKTKISLHIIYITCKNSNSFPTQTIVRSFLIYLERYNCRCGGYKLRGHLGLGADTFH